MKKVAVALVILLTLISLCGCKYRFDYEELVKNVQKIEIIDYDSFSKEEKLLTIISKSDHNQFLLDLSQIEYNYFLGDPPTVKGYCIKLIYPNDDYEIITWAGTSKQGFIQCNKSLFDEMLQKYYSD